MLPQAMKDKCGTWTVGELMQFIANPRAFMLYFVFSSRGRHTRFDCDWSSDVCSSDLLPMKVEFAAADMTERLAPFRAVLEHGGVRDALDRLCAAEWRRGTGQAVRARALKWHGDRCTFEIALRTEEGWHSVIGKVYTGHRSDVFWAMQALGQAGFGPEADFSIARPFVYLASLGVRLEEKVQGPSAKEIFLNGGPDLHLAAAERCGQWLARFHRTAPPLGHVADLAAEFSRYRYWTDLIARLGEPLAAKAERLFRRLEAVAPASGTIADCLGHGS